METINPQLQVFQLHMELVRVQLAVIASLFPMVVASCAPFAELLLVARDATNSKNDGDA